MSEEAIRVMQQKLELYSEKVDHLGELSLEERKILITQTKLQTNLAGEHSKYIMLGLQAKASRNKLSNVNEKRKALTIQATSSSPIEGIEMEGLSWFEIKKLITQWHQTFSNGGPCDFLPNAHQLEESGPHWEPLIEAIYDHGGFEEAARRLGLKFNKQVQDEK